MRALLLAVLVTACGDNVVSGADAAHDLADAACTRRIACDPEYTVTHDDCVAWTVTDLCTRVDCDAEYVRTDELRECIATYADTPCDVIPTICGL